MKGFIFLEADPSGNKTKKVESFVLHPEVEEESFCSGDRFITWGGGAGDINYSQSEDSLTVLCGYVSEIDGAPRIISQRHAANFLRESIDTDSSMQALTVLARRIHGSFAVFHRDFTRRVSICFADRVASRPLWKARSGDAWIVSSHPIAIAAAVPSVELNLGALGAFLLYGGPVQPWKSLFEGVEAIRSGSITRLNGTGTKEQTLWYRYLHQPENNRSMSSWLDLTCERLLRSASRIAQQCDRPVVFFSGGVDSRLTAVALKAVGANPLLVTLGDARNIEVRVSELAAAAMGLQHVVMLRDKHWYLGGLPKAVFESGGSFVWTHGHFSRAVCALRAEFGAEVFLLGDFCEALSKLFCSVEKGQRGMWTAEEFARDFDSIRLPLYRPNNRHRTLALLKPTIREEVEAALRRDIIERYKTVCEVSTDPLIVGDAFFRWESAGTLPTFTMFLDLRGAAAERNLMLDKDVLDLLEIAPGSLRNSANFGALLIRRLNPPASRVPNSNSLLPLCWPPVTHSLSKKCKPLLGKLRRLMLGDSHLTTGAWPEKSALYARDPVWRDYFDKILSNGEMFPEEFFDPDQVRQSWRELLNGNRDNASDIEKLVQLGVMTGYTRSGLACVLGSVILPPGPHVEF
jgi:hypothetical protein